MTFAVFDNFCPQINHVVQSVYAAGFDTWNPNKGEVGSSVYEGMGFWGNHAKMVHSLMRAVNGVVIPNSMFFRVTNVGMERAYIHSDRESGTNTCICYLSDHDTESGTSFFQHKRTGLYFMPSFAQMKEMGIMDEMREDMVSRDPDKWVQTDYVRGTKNRALVFPAPIFHSRFPLEGIGDNPQTGRLIWASHFHRIDSGGELLEADNG